MIQYGEINQLKVIKILEHGAILDGDSAGEILLPLRQMPHGTQIGDTLDVLVFVNSEDRLIASTEEPLGTVGEFVLLRTLAVEKVGTFLDWNVAAVMVPFKEQKQKMIEGRSYIVYLYIDPMTKKVAASANLNKYLGLTAPQYKENEEVEILIHSQTEIGYKAIVNNAHWGILYENEVFSRLDVGDKLTAFIKKVRDDEKIDLSLNKAGFAQIDSISQMILDELHENEGYLPLTDKSNPNIIYNVFGISKKNFKKAVGYLYKNRYIILEPDGIRINE